MGLSNFSFLNPLSRDSGVKLSKYATIQHTEGADKIQDKTVIENVHILYKGYRYTKEKHVKYGFSDDLFLTDVEFTYRVLTGFHYGVYTNLNEAKEEGVGGIGAKGILDFLVFPLIARKLLWDSLIFVGNDENYRLSGTIEDLSKGICWVGLIPSVALALSIEVIRLSLAAAVAILSVYTTLILLAPPLATLIVTAPIWLSVYAIYSCCSSSTPPNPVGVSDKDTNHESTSTLNIKSL